MNPNYVCSRCTRQLLRSQHQLRKASFVSLGKLVTHHGSSELQQPEASAEATDNFQSNSKDGNWIKRKHRRSFAQQYRERQKPTGIDKVLETLFTSNQAQKARASRSRYSRTPLPQTPDNGTMQSTEIETPHPAPEGDAHTTSQLSIAERDAAIQATNVPAKHAAVAERFKSLRSLVEKNDTPLEEIWQECNRLLRYRADVCDIQSQYPLTGTDVTTLRDVLLAICRRENLGPGRISVAPADVIRLYTKFRVMKYWWHEVLWIQLGQAVKLGYSIKGQDLDIDSRPRLQGLLKDILEVWRLFLRLYGVPNSKSRPSTRSGKVDLKKLPDRDETDIIESKRAVQDADYCVDNGWDGLPSLDEANKSPSSLPNELTARFIHFLPRHPNIRRRTKYVAAAAAMTLTCLQASAMDLNTGNQNIWTANPFVEFLQVVAYEVASERETAVSCLTAEGASPEVIHKALTSWLQTTTDETETHTPTTYKLGRPDSHTRHDKRFETNSSVFLTELEKAVNRTDAPRALKLWEKAQNAIEAGTLADASALDKTYVHFISAFFKIRRPEDAISVWNYMIQKGHKPGQMHWTAMLQGCAHRGRSGGGDFASLQNIWSNMMRSGVQPDTGTWTTYIHSLIKCRKWQEGLAALEQLGRMWKAGPDTKALHRDRKSAKLATEPETEKLVPSIAPVRAALSALIDIEKFDCLPAVISWAESHSLQLDTYSYNILLRPLVRTSTPLEIQGHLSKMSLHNCQPDITTFTIILNGLVSNRTSPFRSLSPAEQESTIVSILQDMEAHSIHPNPHTYSTLLDGLLSAPRSPDPSDSGPNIQAARAVLSHMDARNIKPSSYIYTILLTHYFSLSPPDLPAINSLWESLRNGPTTSTDPVFYDRMIEGYADADEYEKALAFVRRMPKEGRSPGWVALGKVLGALERAEEWKVVGELVRDVEDEEGGLVSWGERNLRGKNEFWSRVDGIRERGLLKEEALG